MLVDLAQPRLRDPNLAEGLVATSPMRCGATEANQQVARRLASISNTEEKPRSLPATLIDPAVGIQRGEQSVAEDEAVIHEGRR